MGTSALSPAQLEVSRSPCEGIAELRGRAPGFSTPAEEISKNCSLCVSDHACRRAFSQISQRAERNEIFATRSARQFQGDRNRRRLSAIQG